MSLQPNETNFAPAPTTAPLLAVRNVEAMYDEVILVLRGVSLEVMPAEILTILGPNGAGKSTLIRAIASLVPKFGGSVSLEAADISVTPAHLLARRGLGFVPQTENVFTRMSIADNLRIAADILPKPDRAARIEPTPGRYTDPDSVSDRIAYRDRAEYLILRICRSGRIEHDRKDTLGAATELNVQLLRAR